MKKNEDRPYLELGRRIAELRKKRGWNQDTLAEESGVAISALKDIERGVAEGYLQTRRALAGALGCSLAEFYREDGPHVNEVPNMGAAVEMLSKFSGLPQPLQRIALTVIYRDTSFLKEIPPEIAKEMAREIGRLFLPLQKPAQK